MNRQMETQGATAAAEDAAEVRKTNKNIFRLAAVIGALFIGILAVSSRFSFSDMKVGQIVVAQVRHDSWTGKSCILWSIASRTAPQMALDTKLPQCEY